VPTAARRRNQRGVVFPSPVVILSVVAVAMAAIAYVATRGGEPTEREVTPVARPAETTETPQATPTAKPKKLEPAVKRGQVYVEVFNNSGITGLAGTVGGRASSAGWQVVGTDNWYGTIPASTVYYPPRLKDAAKVLGLDLGIRRVIPAIEPMKFDRLTVVLTADAS
jgi:LytR cell envelope-related transcriptional attenuator